ncbi:MAG TPA: sulfite exporter TauE/SafE family protein [Candidatus Angelobacter sp.]|nr:sulfite exporter TauE/SafE family protein [Candidatus Angelobacter sp.]
MSVEDLISRNKVAASIGYGSLIGLLAGLVGLGGAEERMPFILYYLRLSLEDMITANLLISFAVSGFNFAVRFNAGVWSSNAVYPAVAMIVGSIPGAYFGASLSHRVSRRALKGFISIILSIVIVRVVYGLLVTGATSSPRGVSTLDVVFSLLSGLGVGVISGSAGVAGGEYRIPTLTYLIGLPLKIAGTASQLVSLPTIAVALWKHRRLGFFARPSLTTAVILGIPSIFGAALTGLLVAGLATSYIEIIFILLLAYTVVRLLAEITQSPFKKRAVNI